MSTPIPSIPELDEEDFITAVKSLTEPGDGEEAPRLTATLFHVLATLVEGGRKDAQRRIAPGFAMNVIRQHMFLTLDDVVEYRSTYYEIFNLYGTVLEELIKEDSSVLEQGELIDGEEHHDAYVELLFRWANLANELEDAWNVDDPKAGARLAAIIDARVMFLSDSGFVSYLDQPQIQFEWREGEYQKYVERLTAEAALRDEYYETKDGE